MKKSRFTEEQIAYALKQAELGTGLLGKRKCPLSGTPLTRIDARFGLVRDRRREPSDLRIGTVGDVPTSPRVE